MENRRRLERSSLDTAEHQRDDFREAGGWPGKRSLVSAMTSHGHELPAALRGRLEGGLGEDLSGVRVHTDPDAANAAQALNARAFTIGQAVYFGAGQFDPGSQGGQRLIAHEIAHTVQQHGAESRPQLDSLEVSTPGDVHEEQAETFAQSFISAPSRAGRAAITPVTRGVIARAMIQRDGPLPGGIPDPAAPRPQPPPINPREPLASEMAQGAVRAIQNARATGGTQAVVQEVRNMRARATDTGAAAVEQAVNSSLTAEERDALSGSPGPGGSTSAPQSEQPLPAGSGTPQPTAHGATQGGAQGQGGQGGAQSQGGQVAQGQGGQGGAQGQGGQGGAQGQGGQSGAQGQGGQGGAQGQGGQGGAQGQGGQGGAQGQGGQSGAQGQGGQSGAQGQGGQSGAQGQGQSGQHAQAGQPTPTATPTPAHGPEAPSGPTIGPVHHVAVDNAGGRALIESELSFHENWSALRGGSGQRALHLLAGGGNDLLQGAIGAGVQTGAGWLTELATTKGPLARIPGAGNIIGGALSAYSLFSNGGAGLRTTLNSIGSGIGGAFNADNWRQSPWQTAADLVAGIKSVLDLIGNVCNILSGLAYAFAAIAAVGGMLSVFFPPLAFLVPYIPVAINFGRACGGIATVCMTVSNLISPIPPILRAIHIIFSNNDPIQLAAQEQTYHQEIQGAIANYGNAAADRARAGKGANPLAQFGDGITSGANTYRSAMGGNALPTPGNFRQGVANTERAMGGAARFTDPAQAAQTGRDYFNPAGRTAGNQRSLDKQQRRLDHTEANRDYVNQRADQAVARRDADPTMANVRRAETTAATAERHDQIVAGQQRQVELAGWRTQIPSGQQGTPGNSGPGGEVGNSAEGFHQAVVANRGAAVAQTANDAYQQEQAASGGEAPNVTRNAQGHVQLPDPPGSLAEIDQLDQQIERLEHAVPEQRQVTAAATQTATEAGQQTTGITQAQQVITQRVTQETQRSGREQARIQQQTADMQTRTNQAQSNASSGTGQASGPILGIASAARTVDGLLQRVPSNSFFDVSGAQRSVHQFVVGMDQITGAPAGTQQSQQQTNQAVTQRTGQVQQAQTTNQQANTQGQQLAAHMGQDAAVARTASAQATDISHRSQAAAQSLQQRLETARQQRAQKWQALMSWAVQHRQLRASVLGPDQVQ